MFVCGVLWQPNNFPNNFTSQTWFLCSHVLLFSLSCSFKLTALLNLACVFPHHHLFVLSKHFKFVKLLLISTIRPKKISINTLPAAVERHPTNKQKKQLQEDRRVWSEQERHLPCAAGGSRRGTAGGVHAHPAADLRPEPFGTRKGELVGGKEKKNRREKRFGGIRTWVNWLERGDVTGWSKKIDFLDIRQSKIYKHYLLFCMLLRLKNTWWITIGAIHKPRELFFGIFKKYVFWNYL